MPRGGGNIRTPSGALMLDDEEAFRSAAEGQYGGLSNAEELIQAHRRNQSPALSRASLSQYDVDATEDAENDLAGCAQKLGVDEDSIRSVAVRGHALIAVVEKNGLLVKVVGGWSDRYKAPELTLAEQQDQERIEQQSQLDQQLAQVRREQQVALEQYKAELADDYQVQLQKALDELRGGSAPTVTPASQPDPVSQRHTHEATPPADPPAGDGETDDPGDGDGTGTDGVEPGVGGDGEGSPPADGAGDGAAGDDAGDGGAQPATEPPVEAPAAGRSRGRRSK